MIRQLGAVLLALALPATGNGQTTLDFEDILPPLYEGDSFDSALFPDVYSGFRWDGFLYAFDGDYWSPDYHYSRTSWRTAVLAEEVATVFRPDPFRFFGASFASHARHDQQMKISGYLRGELIWSEVLTLNMSQAGTEHYTAGAVFFETPKALVDRLTFQNYGGVVDSDWEALTDHTFTVDDFTYSATPEPLSIFLLATGLLGVGAARRKRRRS